MSDTDYDLDVRSIDPEYTTTLPRDVNEKIDAATTLSLSTISVTVNLSWRANGDHYRRTYEIPFRVDHDGEYVAAKEIGDAYGDRTSFRIERLLEAIATAEDAIRSFIADIGLDYIVQHTGLRARSDDVTVRSAEADVVSGTTEVEADD